MKPPGPRIGADIRLWEKKRKKNKTNILQVCVVHWRKCIISLSRVSEGDAEAQMAAGGASS